MRYSFTSLALLAGITVSSFAQDCDPNAPFVLEPYDGETTEDPGMTSQLIDYWSESTCYKMSDGSQPNIKEQCKDICIPGGGEDEGEGEDEDKKKTVTSSQSCIFGDAPWSDARTGKPLLCGTDKDFQGTMIMTGYCSCNLPILDIAGDFFIDAVIKAGEILRKFLCPLFKTLDVVTAIGMAAIPPPGRPITGGMIAAIRTSKAYKYAYEAQDAAQQWADFFGSFDFAGQAGCGAPSKIPTKGDLIKAFEPFSNAPDELLPGGINYDKIPCPAKGCRGCKGPNCKKDNENENNNENNSPSKTKDQPSHTTENSQPESTNDSAETTGASTTLLVSSTSSEFTTSTTSSASSTMSAFATSTLDCKALAAKDKDSDTEPEMPEWDQEDLESPTEPEARKRSYPGNFQARRLEKRGKPKSGSACKEVMKSFRYPASGEWKSISWVKPKKYGFNTRDSCDNYDMDTPDTSGDVEYETEHVLEWQTVTNFFNVMGDEITTKFDHPDPKQPASATKLDFCEYWKESWKFDKGQVMDGPDQVVEDATILGVDGVPFKITTEQQKRTPLHWIASYYPYLKGRKKENVGLNEFTLLEKRLNGEYKVRLFGEGSIRTPSKMKALIEGRSTESNFKGDPPDAQARTAILRMRQVVGTLKYMQDKDVSDIFAKEKKRMGVIIKFIDENLPQTPRIKKEEKSVERKLTPWIPQGLGEKWDKYMDKVFEGAKKKATDFMNTHLKDLKAEWDSQKKKEEYKPDPKDDQKKKDEKKALENAHKKVLALIETLGKEWDKVKDWKNPWKSQTPKNQNADSLTLENLNINADPE